MATKKSASKKSTGRAVKKSTSKKSTSRGSSTKSASKSATKSRKSATKKSGAKRTPNAAFMKPMQPSEQLGAVVGASPMPRTEVTKKLWMYIKKNNLQDPKERRMINADDKLRPVFGGKRQVSMFDMTKLVNQHLK
ncbi:MAG: SWIB/MDM2 domain-containing protein [Anaerolineae bacterium]|nr:SWIB/MDM2 domain-containing protein [Gemmatimonadaceae bacterium]